MKGRADGDTMMPTAQASERKDSSSSPLPRVNFLKDFGAGIRDIIGGRSAGYENELMGARTEALHEMERRAAAMGAHAIVGVDVDYEVLGASNNMLMVTVSGTAVTLETL